MSFETAMISLEGSQFNKDTLPHWQIFSESFAQLGRDEMLSRSNDIARFLK